MDTEEISLERVEAVRAFNRFYTNIIGVLQGSYLNTPYSVTEARVVFELAQRDSMELGELRRILDIDAGYLSRILGRFQESGLIERERSAEDGRRQVIQLTTAGREAYATLNERSAKDIADLLAALGEEDQRRLTAAMSAVTKILSSAPQPKPFVLRAPAAGDLGWVVQRHGAVYAEEYGWDETFEALVARIVADYVDHRDPVREGAWIADADGGSPQGCIFCVRKDEETAQLRLLLVEPSARGLGIGSALVDECLSFAKAVGYRKIMLWTNDVLVDARRIYERAGFSLVEEERHRSFGHDLVGQIWARDL